MAKQEKKNQISQSNILWWVRDADVTQGSAKLVLMMLILRANEKDKWSSRPSVPLIAQDCKMSEKSVQRALRKLEKSNLIKTVKRPFKPSRYFINVALLQKQDQMIAAAKEEEEITSPYEMPTLEQEHQLDTDAEKITFDDTAAADPTPAEPPSANPVPVDVPVTVEPVTADLSTISAAIQSLKFVGEKLAVKEVDFLATLLLKSYDEGEILQAIGRFSDYALSEAYKADNAAKYLYKSIANAIECEKEWSAVKPAPPAADEAGEDEYADEPESDDGDESEEEDESEPVYFSVSPDGEVSEVSEAEEVEELTESTLNIYIDASSRASAEIVKILSSIPKGESRYLYCRDRNLLGQVRGSLAPAAFRMGMANDYVIDPYDEEDGDYYFSKITRKIGMREITRAR